MDRSEGEAGPNLVLEVYEPQPHPLAQAQINARTRSNYEVISNSIIEREIETPATGQQLYVGHEACRTKRPPRSREESRLALAETGVDHAAGFGLNADSPCEIGIGIDARALNGAASVVRLEVRECPADDDVCSRATGSRQCLSERRVRGDQRKQHQRKGKPSSSRAIRHSDYAALLHCVTVSVTSIDCVTPVPVPVAVT